MVGEEKFVNQIKLTMVLYREKTDYNPRLVQRNVESFITEENMKRVLGNENLHMGHESHGRYAFSENSLR